MTKREKARQLMEIKGYFNCVEERLKCLAPILPYLESKEGIKTPLYVGSEVITGEIVERMIDLYEQYWREEEVDQMLMFFQSAVGRKLVESSKGLACKLMSVLDDYIMEKMQVSKRSKLH